MSVHRPSRFGLFCVFGFTKNPQFLERKLPDSLGIRPSTIDFGTAGRFFLYNSAGDIAETQDVIALKLGFVRSPTASPLSAKQLIDQGSVTPKTIDWRAFRGNALVASFDKREPRLLAFKTIMSAPQLYYSVTDQGFLCATNLKVLVAMLDRVELNLDAVVPQFLFGTVHGPATHFRNVYRLFPGELVRWKDGHLTVDLAQDLHFTGGDFLFEQADARALTHLYERFKRIIDAYISDTEASGNSFANLLSGGIDSSFLQLAINELRSRSKSRTLSYAVQAPSFEREINYAKQAITIFDTEHTFINVTEREFPELLIEATKILAQPVLTSAEPCKLAIGKFLSQTPDAPKYLFTAQGADTLFGSSTVKKLNMLESIKRVPASGIGLTLVGRLLKPFSKQGERLLKVADLVMCLDDFHHFNAPINTAVSIADFALARRAFGDKAVKQALEDRRNREIKYLNSGHYTEKVIVLGLLSDCYANEVQSSQLFLDHNIELLSPFQDEDIIRLSFAIPPEIRYVKAQRHKYLLREILELRTVTPITRQPKGGSMFHRDLHRWMQSGSLRDMISEISLPGSLKRADFEQLVENYQLPRSLIVWHLLAFSVFQKHVLTQSQSCLRNSR